MLVCTQQLSRFLQKTTMRNHAFIIYFHNQIPPLQSVKIVEALNDIVSSLIYIIMKNVEKVSHDMSILKDEDGLFTTVSITNEDGKCVAAVTEFHSYQR